MHAKQCDSGAGGGGGGARGARELRGEGTWDDSLSLLSCAHTR